MLNIIEIGGLDELCEVLHDVLGVEMEDDVEETEKDAFVISEEEALDIFELRCLSLAIEKIGEDSSNGRVVVLPPALVERYNELCEEIADVSPDSDVVKVFGKGILTKARKIAEKQLKTMKEGFSKESEDEDD